MLYDLYQCNTSFIVASHQAKLVSDKSSMIGPICVIQFKRSMDPVEGWYSATLMPGLTASGRS